MNPVSEERLEYVADLLEVSVDAAGKYIELSQTFLSTLLEDSISRYQLGLMNALEGGIPEAAEPSTRHSIEFRFFAA